MKCQCPCPDYVKVPLKHGIIQTWLLKGFGTVLRGKKATVDCAFCGVGLCEDCLILIIGRYDDDSGWPELYTLCSSCAEEVER